MYNFTTSDFPRKNEIDRTMGIFSTTAAGSTYPIDERPIFILILSLAGAGIVLLISTLFLCCYFYRTRLRRQNYPLPLTLQNNAARIGRGTSVLVSNDENSITLAGCNRPRSPVTTEADIYGFDNSGAFGQRPSTNGIDQKVLNDERNDKNGFDNPLYKKSSLASSVMQSLDFGTIYVDTQHQNVDETRKDSSPGSVALPGLPSMLIVDESIDDHRRLVPNDLLSLEIDRSQRRFRDDRETQRNVYERERRANDDGDDLPSIVGHAAAANLDAEDGPSKSQSAQAPSRKKLRRRLAETIANDRVFETTVTFTNETSDSPVSSAMPAIMPWTNQTLDKRLYDLKRKHDSDDDDLEVIFKERTPL